MEHIFASEANLTDLVYRKEDVDAVLKDADTAVYGGQQLIDKLRIDLTAATTRADGLFLQVRNMQSDCAEHSQDLVAAVMKLKVAEAKLNDPIYQECCANLKKAEADITDLESTVAYATDCHKELEQQRDRLAGALGEIKSALENRHIILPNPKALVATAASAMREKDK